MQKLISVIAGLLTLIAGYHLYLNITFTEFYTFEQSIKLLSAAFKDTPITLSFLSAGFILVSSMVSFFINKIWKLTAERSKSVQQKIQTNVERTKKITDIRNQFFEKVFLKFDSARDYPHNPMYRIKGEYSEVNIKDINDDKFPLSDYRSKYEVFDFKEDGIEVLGGDNFIGFNLFIDDDNNWDVLDRFDKLRKGEYSKPKLAYSVHFISYEDVLHVDWDGDPYENNITISCHFRYKTHMRHPFKEFRYYIEIGEFGYRQLDPKNRKNFARFDLIKPFKIYTSRFQSFQFRKNIKDQKQLWK